MQNTAKESGHLHWKSTFYLSTSNKALMGTEQREHKRLKTRQEYAHWLLVVTWWEENRRDGQINFKFYGLRYSSNWSKYDRPQQVRFPVKKEMTPF